MPDVVARGYLISQGTYGNQDMAWASIVPGVLSIDRWEILAAQQWGDMKQRKAAEGDSFARYGNANGCSNKFGNGHVVAMLVSPSGKHVCRCWILWRLSCVGWTWSVAWQEGDIGRLEEARLGWSSI